MTARPLIVPEFGPEVPRRGNAFSRMVAHLLLRLSGWRFAGDFPNAPKFVLVVAPHTSNWDFPVGLMAMFALGLRGSYLGKHSLFRWPFGIVMRWLGGIPVDRSSAHNVVFQTAAFFKNSERLVLVVSPEGTRRRLLKWRTGFWYIARGANVPMVPIAFDYSTKTFRLFPMVAATADIDADFRMLHSCFQPEMARHPEQYSGPSRALR